MRTGRIDDAQFSFHVFRPIINRVAWLKRGTLPPFCIYNRRSVDNPIKKGNFFLKKYFYCSEQYGSQVIFQLQSQYAEGFGDMRFYGFQ